MRVQCPPQVLTILATQGVPVDALQGYTNNVAQCHRKKDKMSKKNGANNGNTDGQTVEQKYNDALKYYQDCQNAATATHEAALAASAAERKVVSGMTETNEAVKAAHEAVNAALANERKVIGEMTRTDRGVMEAHNASKMAHNIEVKATNEVNLAAKLLAAAVVARG